jgi:hypothetical protein
MRKKQTFRFLTVLTVSMGLLVTALGGEGRGQEEASPPFALDAAALRPGQYVGAASCASGNCHGSVQPRDVYAVRQDEYFIWLKQDRHTQAYNVLLTEQSVRIARNMKLRQQAHESKVCLDCHALYVPQDVQARPLDLAEGVSCEACHGPAGGWLARHTESGWTHEMSVQAGMKDLRDLSVRGQTCLSCHLGDVQKTVNHELIAAGHPDLIFELDNYSAVMPPHWNQFSEKRREQKREDLQSARVWAVGQVVAFREGMLQLVRRARSQEWPEFAEMNCYGCHHSLRDGEWRQMRGYKFKAGLPAWNPARYAVMRVLVSTFAPEQRAQLDAQVERLERHIAYLSTPQEQVATTAAGLAETMERVIPQIRQADIDNAAAARLIDAIAAEVPYLIDAEIHSVEQAIMAINALAGAMARNNPALAQGGISRTIDKLYNDVKDRERFDRAQFTRHMAELRRQIQ